MSDYGGEDEYSDYGDEWYYIEDGYIAADELAEHAVASPPPATYADEDALSDWDRFNYFDDLEYASDGYDNATFEVHKPGTAVTGEKRKRKREMKSQNKRQRQKGDVDEESGTIAQEHAPIVWRSHAERVVNPRPLDDNAQSYALLKDWREKLKETPKWARGPLPDSARSEDHDAHVSEDAEDDLDEDLDDQEDGDMGISQDALMAALQRQLSAAGGPLSGMDPQQLLEFAMRMAADKDAGDDIAGEMADAMLGGEDDEEDDGDAEENLLSWVAQQRNASANEAAEEKDAPQSPEVAHTALRPPTPPSSEANRSIRANETVTRAVESHADTSSLKRKADDNVDEGAEKVVKKRVTKSFDAPTAASQARAKRPTRGKRA